MPRELMEVEPREKTMVEMFRWLPGEQQHVIESLCVRLGGENRAAAIAQHRRKVLRLVHGDRTVAVKEK